MILQDPKVHTIPVPKPLVISDDRKAVVYTDRGGLGFSLGHSLAYPSLAPLQSF